MRQHGYAFRELLLAVGIVSLLALIALAFIKHRPQYGRVYIVTTSANSGPGSLRAAIRHANRFPGTSIVFQIPSSDPGFRSGVITIQPWSPLPPLTGTKTKIDGRSWIRRIGKRDFAPPTVFVNGARAGANTDGLTLLGTQCEMSGIGINGFGGDGVSNLRVRLCSIWAGFSLAHSFCPVFMRV